MVVTDQIYNQALNKLPQVAAKLRDIGQRIWQMGWAEANAGNLSIDISDELRAAGLLPSDDTSSYYLVSRTGSRYRSYQSDLESALLLAVTTDSETAFYPKGSRPTSEWSSHMELHRQLKARSGNYRCVLHTHPAEIIALSQTVLFDDPKALNEQLLSLLPELSIYLPEGFATAPYAAPGSLELARLSGSCMGSCKALIWQKHGLLCFGKDIDEAFDYTEIMVKAAKIFLILSPPNSY